MFLGGVLVMWRLEATGCREALLQGLFPIAHIVTLPERHPC